MTHSLEPGGFSTDPGPSGGTAWHWRLLDAAGAQVRVDSVPGGARFGSQSDAESWLGETWRELRAEGVDAVTLCEEQREVYGPMSLHSALD